MKIGRALSATLTCVDAADVVSGTIEGPAS